MRFKKNILKIFLGLFVIVTPSAILGATLNKRDVNAWWGSEARMNWKQKGSKKVDASTYYTEHDGYVKAKKQFLINDKIYWSGKARAWKSGFGTPQRTILSINTIIEGLGSPSVSASASLGSNGVEVGAGVSVSSTEKGKNFEYSFLNTKWSEVNYSYSGSIWFWSYVGISTNATFMERNKYVVVDSETDKIFEEKKHSKSLLC